ncbi:MAG: type 4a pilus biogenesis protein PilO [Actinomycetota bacterium]|jgi:Tfp pilus assembly protein PilO|nr:type 4a pilus biogenesis protein PilO [Actinomycetota bacterium]
MTIRVKIIAIVAILVVIILLTVAFVVTNISTMIKNSNELGIEKENSVTLKSRLGELLAVRDKYNLLEAEYSKYLLQLPRENDMSIFTNEINDIAKYSDVNISSINYSEKAASKEGEKLGLSVIEASLIVEGSYYNIMNFLNTIEKMTRIVKVNNLVFQTTEDDYENINANINIEMYYKN